jgi:hypothetical protein
MTLQDEVARAFVQEGDLRKIVRDLTKEDLTDFDLEEPSGEGWADVVAKTAHHAILFEIKTHVKELPTGEEVHEENVAGAIRQLKKYRRSHPKHVLVVIIPQQDAKKWAPFYANAGFWVIGWSAKRILRCATCQSNCEVSLVAPYFCTACGSRGPLEHLSLQQPSFILYEAYPPKDRAVPSLEFASRSDSPNEVALSLEKFIKRWQRFEENGERAEDLQDVVTVALHTSDNLRMLHSRFSSSWTSDYQTNVAAVSDKLRQLGHSYTGSLDTRKYEEILSIGADSYKSSCELVRISFQRAN